MLAERQIGARRREEAQTTEKRAILAQFVTGRSEARVVERVRIDDGARQDRAVLAQRVKLDPRRGPETTAGEELPPPALPALQRPAVDPERRLEFSHAGRPDPLAQRRDKDPRSRACFGTSKSTISYT